MNKLLLSIVTTTGLMALPVLTPDSITVDPNDIRIGQYVYALPNTDWHVWGEDWTDFDYNDIVMDVHITPSGNVLLQYIGSNSSMDDYFVVNGQTVNQNTNVLISNVVLDGSPLDIQLHTQNGDIYNVGSRHILVDGPVSENTSTPEPSTTLFVGLGLVLLGLWKKVTQ